LCGKKQDDDGIALNCSEAHPPALLQTRYLDQQFSPCADDPGLFRYRNWLPVAAGQHGVSRTAVYRSRGLAEFLCLPNLWIAFNGYWPERGAFFETATFKELEAHTVVARLPQQSAMLIVPSSGNTGAAFAWICSRKRLPCLVIVPRKSLSRFSFSTPLDPCVCLVVLTDGDYPDAIALSEKLSRLPSFQLEGGVKNVGRRDGLATVMLSAFEEMQRMPDYYFQAVGSGTGAIAVHEAAKRLRHATGAAALPRLMLCQNIPFTPIYDSWRLNRRSLLDGRAGYFRRAIKEVHADELTNWAPPYEIRGGVHDCLVESKGDVLVADNSATVAAIKLFRELEGTDIEPAAGVALACLCDAVAEEKIPKDSVVLLNVTGGGRAQSRQEQSAAPARPQLHLTREALAGPESVEQVVALCESAGSVI
jgi:cysteate synthase